MRQVIELDISDNLADFKRALKEVPKMSLDTPRLVAALRAEGLIRAEEEDTFISGGKTHESAALLSRITQDQDAMLRVAQRLGLRSLSVAPNKEHGRVVPTHLGPNREQRRREARSARRAAKGSTLTILRVT